MTRRPNQERREAWERADTELATLEGTAPGLQQRRDRVRRAVAEIGRGPA